MPFVASEGGSRACCLCGKPGWRTFSAELLECPCGGVLASIEQRRDLQAHYVLRPGGLMAIEVPNARCLTARLLGRHWLGWDLPNHIHHFGPASLRALLERHGFTVLAESHWSVEFGPFHILQTILNALGCSCNQLSNLIQREELHTNRRASAASQIAMLVLVVLLAIPRGLLSGLLSLCGQGEVFRCSCSHSKKAV